MPLGEPKKQMDCMSQPRPHGSTQAQMLAYAGNLKIDLHLGILGQVTRRQPTGPTREMLWCYPPLLYLTRDYLPVK